MLRELVAGLLAAGCVVGADDLAGFDDQFEPAQVVVELLVGFLAEVLGQCPAERSGGTSSERVTWTSVPRFPGAGTNRTSPALRMSASPTDRQPIRSPPRSTGRRGT